MSSFCHSNKSMLYSSEKMALDAVKKDGLNIIFVLKEYQTEEVCLAAVRQNGHALQYVNEQTPEICLAAVNQIGDALQYVDDQNPEICLAAINESGWSIKFVKEQTPDLCLAAVTNFSGAIQNVNEQTDDLCLLAVNKNPTTLISVKNQTSEICNAAFDKDPYTIQLIRDIHLHQDIIIKLLKLNAEEYIDNKKLIDYICKLLTKTIFSRLRTKIGYKKSDFPSYELYGNGIADVLIKYVSKYISETELSDLCYTVIFKNKRDEPVNLLINVEPSKIPFLFDHFTSSRAEYVMKEILEGNVSAVKPLFGS